MPLCRILKLQIRNDEFLILGPGCAGKVLIGRVYAQYEENASERITEGNIQQM